MRLSRASAEVFLTRIDMQSMNIRRVPQRTIS
jgi:hypothetical protein